MTNYSTSHWTVNEGKCGLLLFAQALEEMLNMHSYDSYKVPALNFHYICLEILNVIDLIETDIVDKGNLVPLLAEARTLFVQDKVAQSFLGNDFDAIFATKNSKGEYDRKPLKVESTKDVDPILPVIKKRINYIVLELGRHNQYFSELIKMIRIQILDSKSDLSRLNSLYDLTRIVASELINKGFSQAYIYNRIKHFFFNTQRVVDSVNIIDEFFNCFSTDTHKYSIYLPVNSIKQKNALEEYGPFQIAENIYELFDATIPYILKFECESQDPYSARNVALNFINICLSLNQFIKHNKYAYNPKYSEVFDQESKEVTFIKKPIMPIMQSSSALEKMKDIEISDLLNACLKLDVGVFQALQSHSSAIISKSVDNQLINLWTAVEAMIPIIRKDGLVRINQIGNALVSALSKDYFSILLHQLVTDISILDKNCCEKIEQIDYKGTNAAKLVAVLLLPEYGAVYQEINKQIICVAPLLACRMYRYKFQWANTKQIQEMYKAHGERLMQQIMRIYRTRNMLVHSGSSLRYTEYVLQNLHYYIDSFINLLIIYHKDGYTSVQTILDAIQLQEQQYLRLLSEATIVDKANIKSYIHVE